jgi:hypothetical protein
MATISSQNSGQPQAPVLADRVDQDGQIDANSSSSASTDDRASEATFTETRGCLRSKTATAARAE